MSGYIERFQAAVFCGDDDDAETYVEHLTPGDLPTLRKMLNSGDIDGRWWAIRGIARLGGEADVWPLVVHLGDGEPTIRAAAAMALGCVHGAAPKVVSAHLSKLAGLLSDDDGLVRQAAVEGLALCGDDAVDVLAEALEQNHDGLRVQAAAALRRIGTLKTALPLYKHLEDPNPLVRHHAFEALTDLGLLANVIVTR